MAVHAWQEIEIELTARIDYANAYTGVEVDFTNSSGATLRRPANCDILRRVR